MRKFIVTVDSSCDGSLEKLHQQEVPIIFMPYTDGVNSFVDNMKEDENKKFYQDMRDGVVFKTSQINEFNYEEFFREVYEKYHLPIIHISLCEALSKSIENARNAASRLKEEGIEVTPIDSYIASAGVYLEVEKAVEYRDAGMGYEEAAKTLQDFALHVHTWYVTNDLKYFARGGRLPKIVASFARGLNLNVILRCSRYGKLEIAHKVIGRNSAKKKIVELINETAIDPEKQTLYVAQADNIEGANDLVNTIIQGAHFKDAEINPLGKIIGAHTGPGLIAVFYYGKEVLDKE